MWIELCLPFLCTIKSTGAREPRGQGGQLPTLGGQTMYSAHPISSDIHYINMCILFPITCIFLTVISHDNV